MTEKTIIEELKEIQAKLDKLEGRLDTYGLRLGSYENNQAIRKERLDHIEERQNNHTEITHDLTDLEKKVYDLHDRLRNIEHAVNVLRDINQKNAHNISKEALSDYPELILKDTVAALQERLEKLEAEK